MPLPSFDKVINQEKKAGSGLPSFDEIIRPKKKESSRQKTVTPKVDVLRMPSLKSTIKPMVAQGKKIDHRNKVQKTLDYVFKENPVSATINYIPATIAKNLGLDGEDGKSKVASTGSKKLDTVLGKTGNVAAPIADAFLSGGGGGAAKLAIGAGERLASKVGSKLGQTAIRGATVGGLTSGGAAMGQGKSVKDTAIDTAIGGATGGVLDAGGSLLSKAGRSILDKYKPRPVEPTLALPEGRLDTRLRQAQQRSATTPGTEPIVNEHQFKLDSPSESVVQRTKNIEESRKDLSSIDSEIRKIESRYQKAVNDQYKYLKNSMDNRGGVTQGSLIRDGEGAVTGRVGRISNNPQWYREFHAQNGRAPTNKELYQLARQHIDEGFSEDGVNVPSWKQENGYDDTVQALHQVRDTLRSSLREMDGNMTNVPLKEEKLSFQRTDSQPQIATETTPSGSDVYRQSEPSPVQRPATTEPPLKERGFAQTLKASEKTPQSFVDRLKSAYQPITNEGTLAQANKRINKDVEEATSYVLGNSRFSADKATTAQRLIDHYNNNGNVQRAVDIAEKVSAEATKAGQAIQALSMFNRLTPEGVLVYAQRMASKTNENLSLLSKEVKVTPEMSANLTGLAQATQKMTGVKDLANDVMSILDKAKAGGKLSDAEASTLKTFVNESKQFVQETTKKPKPPRPPQHPKDKRIRQNVVSFLDAQEQAAKERLRARGIRISSTPLDVWADYAIIGAAKMGKGAIKFADWSEAMVKDLGEEIRPHLDNLYERAREAYEASAKKVTEQTISQAVKLTEKVIKNKQLSPQDADSLRSLAVRVSGLSGDAKRMASQDLQVVLQQLDRPTKLKKVSSIQTMAQLLNPKTQVRNALGNELFYRVERLNKLLATPIDIARSMRTGGPRTVTFRTNNQGEYWKNWMNGAKAGWRGANVNGLETQYDLASPAFKGKYNPLTYLEKALGASLKSFDTAAYMRAYNNTIGEMATLRAVNEGQRGNKELIQKYIREADDHIKNIADEYGRYATFQDNNFISQGLTALKRGLNKWTTGSTDFGVGDLVIKYPKTPGALLMRALEYSPAGFVRSLKILSQPWRKEEPNTAEATQALSRAMIGTLGLSGLGYFLLDKGIVTGSASKDKDIKDLQKSAGQGQYQVNLTALKRFISSGFDPNQASIKKGDILYTYDWMQPVSMAISIGANTKKNLNEGKDGLSGLPGTVFNSLEGGLGTLTEQSVLSGIKRAAEGYPGQTATDKIIDIVSDVPASFVPTIVNQTKQLMDNKTRETYDPSKLQSSLNYAKSKIPRVEARLPQKYDTLGQPKETYQNNSAFNVLLNPGFTSRYKLTPEAQMIVDLINDTGDEKLAPRVPPKTINIDGVNVKLNGDQFSRYQQLQGKATKDLLQQYDPSASKEVRSKQMEKILLNAGKQAREKLKTEIKASK